MSRLLLILFLLVVGCTASYAWKETVVTIRQADRDTINEICRGLGLQESVNGCYDKGIVYCPDDRAGLETCLHETRHALVGGFHK